MKFLLYILLFIGIPFGGLSQIDNNAIFGGGFASGYDKDCYHQSNGFNAVFGGGDGDGYAHDCYQQENTFNTIFAGGEGGGYAKDCYQQENMFNSIFAGGEGSGYAKDCYQQENLYNNIFAGGEGSNGMSMDCKLDPIGCEIDVALGNDTVFCAPDNFVLDAGTFDHQPTYLWQDGSDEQTFSVTESGEYIVLVIDEEGCSGRDTINVVINPIFDVDLGKDTTLCFGETLNLDVGSGATSYHWNNGVGPVYEQQSFSITSTGQYYVDVILGDCKTTDTINVIVQPELKHTYPVIELCAGESASIFGNEETTSGIYTKVVESSTGCDSTLIQELIIYPAYDITLAAITICDGEEVEILGQLESTPGIYSQTFQTVNGCDSIVTQELIVSPSIDVDLGGDVTLCYGEFFTLDAGAGADTYRWNKATDPLYFQQTITVNVSGKYYVDVTLGSCLASDTVNVTVLPELSHTYPPMEICAGESITIFGNSESTSGTYTQVMQSKDGCDSTLIQVLNVLPTYNITLPVMDICDGDEVEIFGNLENTSGTYTKLYQAMNGCDSIVTQELVVSPNIDVDLGGDVTLCYGASILLDAGPGADTYRWNTGMQPYHFRQEFTVSESGKYYVDVTLGSCSASDTVNVTVLPELSHTYPPIEICAGESATIFGNSETTAGIYTQVVPSSIGCDSTLIQQLIVLPTYNVTLPVISICDGDEIEIFGNLENTSGTYTKLYQAMNGCDSTVTQQLIVSPAIDVDLGKDTTLCFGETIVLNAGHPGSLYNWNGGAQQSRTYTVTQSGKYYVEVTSGSCSGSDTINVTILPQLSHTYPVIEICAGESATIFGNEESTSGTYTSVVTSSTGCDSTLVQELIVHQHYDITLNNIEICQGEEINIFGNLETEAGSYMETYSSVNGCDSIVRVNLIVHPSYTIESFTEICANDSIYLGGAYQNTTGTYSDIYSSVYGCDSVSVTHLTVLPLRYNDLPLIEICEGEAVEIFGNMEVTSGIYTQVLENAAANGCDSITRQELKVHPVYTIELFAEICEGDSILITGAYQYASGVYTEVLQTVSGCDSTIVTVLEVKPLPELSITASSTNLFEGEEAELTANGAEHYTWSPDVAINCLACPTVTVSPKESTTYYVEGEWNGCYANDSILISVDGRFRIPQGFSPNGDGVNDYFVIEGIQKYPQNTLIIFNRWGNKVYEVEGYQSDWDGTNQFGLSMGDELPDGTYFYILDLGKESPEGKQVYKGYIYLNR